MSKQGQLQPRSFPPVTVKLSIVKNILRLKSLMCASPFYWNYSSAYFLSVPPSNSNNQH